MSESNASMVQEGEGERGLTPDTPAARAHGGPQRPEVGRAEVSQFAALQVTPEQFDGIELRGIGRQAFDLQPGLLGREVARHAATLVRTEAIPDEHDPLTAEVSLQGAQEGDERRVGIRARVGLKVPAGAATIPPKRERGGDRQPFPVRPGVVQDGGLAARRPRAPHDGMLRHAAFVLEDYPGVPAPRVFFTCGQRWRRHCAIAASSRSRAWRAGRCSDQFNPCRMRQTWDG